MKTCSLQADLVKVLLHVYTCSYSENINGSSFSNGILLSEKLFLFSYRADSVIRVTSKISSFVATVSLIINFDEQHCYFSGCLNACVRS